MVAEHIHFYFLLVSDMMVVLCNSPIFFFLVDFSPVLMASVQRNIECGANFMTLEQVQVHDKEEHK